MAKSWYDPLAKYDKSNGFVAMAEDSGDADVKKLAKAVRSGLYIHLQRHLQRRRRGDA